VIIAEGAQGPEFEFDLLVGWLEAALIPKPILNYRRVLALQHEDRLLDLNTVNLVGEDKEGIKTKLLEITKPLRIHDRWVTVRGEIECTSVQQKSLFQLGQKDIAADRGLWWPPQANRGIAAYSGQRW
jgi:hypothetical protein